MTNTQPFLVTGNVVFISPSGNIRLTILVPWSEEDTNIITGEMKLLVERKIAGVMRYLVNEAIIPNLREYPVKMQVFTRSTH